MISNHDLKVMNSGGYGFGMTKQYAKTKANSTPQKRQTVRISYLNHKDIICLQHLSHHVYTCYMYNIIIIHNLLFFA